MWQFAYTNNQMYLISIGTAINMNSSVGPMRCLIYLMNGMRFDTPSGDSHFPLYHPLACLVAWTRLWCRELSGKPHNLDECCPIHFDHPHNGTWSCKFICWCSSASSSFTGTRVKTILFRMKAIYVISSYFIRYDDDNNASDDKSRNTIHHDHGSISTNEQQQETHRIQTNEQLHRTKQ